jgi:acyl-CoA reductase-like NAD-dependent aldehyde dehydrogenase
MSLNTTATSSRIQSISPVDGSVFAERQAASDLEIEDKLTKATNAQREWKMVPISERASICRRMVSLLVGRAEQLGSELTWQMGRPIRYSPMEIRSGFQERALYMIDIAEAELADIAIEPKDNFRRFIRRDPIGLVLALMPWNYPYLCSVNVVVPAVMAGNSVILKPAAQTPLVAERYAEAFNQAGLPEGVFQVLHVTHDQVETIIRDPRVGFVAFTGSVGGGHAVQRAAAERFIGTAWSWVVRIRRMCARMLSWSRPSRTWWTVSSLILGSHAVRSKESMSIRMFGKSSSMDSLSLRRNMCWAIP